MLVPAARPIARCALCAVLFLAFAGVSSALEGIDLSADPSIPAEGECSRLVQIKYPFLSCRDGETTQSDVEEVWENTRRLPHQSDWTEGNGYFGPLLNPN